MKTFIRIFHTLSSVLVGGIIVVVPALLEIKFWDQYHYWPIAGTAAIGGLIGILFSIPLRRILIVEEKLCFPEGVATAEVLKVGEAGTSSLLYITFGAILGALFKFGEIGLKFWNSESSFAFFLGPLVLHFGLYTSPALFSVGYIVNIKIAIVVFMGAVTG
jgi:putative OPT family oligopeptide transporter